MLPQHKDVSTLEWAKKKSQTVFTSCEITFAYGDKGHWRVSARGRIGKDDPAKVLGGVAKALSETISNLEEECRRG